MFLLKLLLLMLAVKLLWVIGAVVVMSLFWGGAWIIIIARSLREKLAPRPQDMRFPR